MIHLSGDIWQRWEAKRKYLMATGLWELAGLFRGHEGSGFRSAAKKILYTGKATAGAFEPSAMDVDYFGCNKGPFWSFARRLNRLTGGNSEELENIAWSNICKIGTVSENPGEKLVDAQRCLAVETLRQEWVELLPTLVVCVAEGYQEQIIYDAFGVIQDQEDGFETVRSAGMTFWRRFAKDGLPAFLWMKHPQGKPLAYISAAQGIAEEMLAR